MDFKWFSNSIENYWFMRKAFGQTLRAALRYKCSKVEVVSITPSGLSSLDNWDFFSSWQKITVLFKIFSLKQNVFFAELDFISYKL